MNTEQIHFLRWFDDKNGIYITNKSNILEPIQTKVKIVNYHDNNHVYYETEMCLEFGIEYYICLSSNVKNRFKFLFYNKEGTLILELDNEYKNEESIFSFLDEMNIVNL